jgi:hypothetical protein
MDSLAFYVGSWQCSGTSFATAEQPKEEHWQARVEVAPELGGHWLSVQMIGPGDNRTVEHKGYDPEHRRWTHVAMLADGTWSWLASPGWDGNHMVFTPQPDDDTRATFTKLGDRAYSHAVSKRSGEKQWEKVCKKS